MENFSKRRLNIEPPVIEDADVFSSDNHVELQALNKDLSEVTDFFVRPVLRMIIGRDKAPFELLSHDVTQLSDIFSRLVLQKNLRPLTFDSLIRIFEEKKDELSFEINSFIVGEGGQIPWSLETANLNRSLRFVVTCRNLSGDEVMMSIDDQPSNDDGLIQLLSWDPVKTAYNFYQRQSGSWFYVGDSWDALRPDTRGKGPFDGHINGSLVMKELKFPWLHWGSQSEQIESSAFNPENKILEHWLFLDRVGAEILEGIVVSGINKWTQARISKSLESGKISGATSLLRQMVDPRTVNIVSSPDLRGDAELEDTIRVPWEIFLNSEFWGTIGELRKGTISGVLKISSTHYLNAVKAVGYELRDSITGFKRPGDSFFVLATPAPAFEDLSVIKGLIDSNIISTKLACAIQAVDFFNPIQSYQRSLLSVHFPEFGAMDGGTGSIEEQMILSMLEKVKINPESVEAEITQRMELSDEEFFSTLSDNIGKFVENLKIRLQSQDGVLDLIKLVGSRRKFFRSLKISEFSLGLPFSLQDEEPYSMMRQDGQLVKHADWNDLQIKIS